MEKIRTGIIGLGKIAHTHAAALKKLPETDFIAACSRDIEKAKSFSSQYNVVPYNNLEEMIEKSKIQCLLICTPHQYHEKPAVIAAKKGVHVLCEKPLAATLEDCDSILDAAKKSGIKLGTIFQKRFYFPVQRMKAAIEQGKIGKPVLGTVNVLGWRSREYFDSDPWRGKWIEEGGGVLVNQTSHQIDTLQWLMGPIDSVAGFWANLNHPYIEVEDTSVAVIKFKNGGLGSIVVSNSQNPALYGRIMINGDNGATISVRTEGKISYLPGVSSPSDPPVNDYWTIKGEEELLEKWQKDDIEFFNKRDSGYYYEMQIKDFLNAIVNDTNPLVTGEEGRISVEIFSAIYRSQRDGKIIKFPLKPEYKKDMDGRLNK